MRRSPMLLVVLIDLVALAACGGGATASSIAVSPPSTTPAVITAQAPPTTATTTAAHAPSATSTIVERVPSDDPADPAWVGIGFRSTCFDTPNTLGLDRHATFAEMVGDPINQRLILISGVGNDRPYEATLDVWAIDLNTGEWIQLLAPAG